jgi:hypothetical protein
VNNKKPFYNRRLHHQQGEIYTLPKHMTNLLKINQITPC